MRTLVILLALATVGCTTMSETPSATDAGAAVPPFGGPVGAPDGSTPTAEVDSIGDAPPSDTTGSSREPATDAHHPDTVPDAVPDVATPPVDTRPDATKDTEPDHATPPDTGWGVDVHLASELVLAPPLVLDTHPTTNYRGVDSAWSDAASAFLVVYGNGPIGGALLSIDGEQIGPGFLLTGEPYDGTNWTQNPRVVESGDGWLAAWHKELPGAPVVQVRRVQRAGDAPALDSPVLTISAGGSKQESPVALATIPTAMEHVAVWASDGLRARRLQANGEPLSDEIALSEPGVWVEFPSAAWHPGCACVFVAFMRETAAGANVQLLRIDDASAQPKGPPVDLTGPIGFAKVTDIEVDTAAGQVIATWYEVRDGTPGFGAQRFSADGTPTTGPLIIFAPFGSYDGYDLAFSAVTGTSLAAFHGTEVAAFTAELAPDLSSSPPVPLGLGGAAFGVYLPRVVAHPTAPAWLVASTPDYARVVVQRISRP